MSKNAQYVGKVGATTPCRNMCTERRALWHEGGWPLQPTRPWACRFQLFAIWENSKLRSLFVIEARKSFWIEKYGVLDSWEKEAWAGGVETVWYRTPRRWWGRWGGPAAAKGSHFDNRSRTSTKQSSSISFLTTFMKRLGCFLKLKILLQNFTFLLADIAHISQCNL